MKRMVTHAEAIIRAQIDGIVQLNVWENGNIEVHTKNVFCKVSKLESIRGMINATDVEIGTRHDNEGGLVYTFID